MMRIKSRGVQRAKGMRGPRTRERRNVPFAYLRELPLWGPQQRTLDGARQSISRHVLEGPLGVVAPDGAGAEAAHRPKGFELARTRANASQDSGLIHSGIA